MFNILTGYWNRTVYVPVRMLSLLVVVRYHEDVVSSFCCPVRSRNHLRPLLGVYRFVLSPTSYQCHVITNDNMNEDVSATLVKEYVNYVNILDSVEYRGTGSKLFRFVYTTERKTNHGNVYLKILQFIIT